MVKRSLWNYSMYGCHTTRVKIPALYLPHIFHQKLFNFWHSPVLKSNLISYWVSLLGSGHPCFLASLIPRLFYYQKNKSPWCFVALDTCVNWATCLQKIICSYWDWGDPFLELLITLISLKVAMRTRAEAPVTGRCYLSPHVVFPP